MKLTALKFKVNNHFIRLAVLVLFCFSCSKKENDRYEKEVNKVYNSKPITDEMVKNLTETKWELTKKELFLYSADGKMHPLPVDNGNIGKLISFGKKNLTISDGDGKIIGNFFSDNMQFEINGIDTLSNYYGTSELYKNKDMILYSNVKYTKNKKTIKSYVLRLLFQNKDSLKL
ncbi:MAG: hypothetical protein LBE92_17895 [Chryseobacterium sp.]|jgi:hypothetical protein|uniref:hypothetical protein n=1 Tax=Chryseobacterium sp. TaxID=1871047 RepID=UPI00281E54CD|nr:hypothetical protein [Chryseobacterium sp.]MDR2237998.1 hypothetical protein [Chryseobacterium sp.]